MQIIALNRFPKLSIQIHLFIPCILKKPYKLKILDLMNYLENSLISTNLRLFDIFGPCLNFNNKVRKKNLSE